LEKNLAESGGFFDDSLAEKRERELATLDDKSFACAKPSSTRCNGAILLVRNSRAFTFRQRHASIEQRVDFIHTGTAAHRQLDPGVADGGWGWADGGWVIPSRGCPRHHCAAIGIQNLESSEADQQSDIMTTQWPLWQPFTEFHACRHVTKEVLILSYDWLNVTDRAKSR